MKIRVYASESKFGLNGEILMEIIHRKPFNQSYCRYNKKIYQILDINYDAYIIINH